MKRARMLMVLGVVMFAAAAIALFWVYRNFSAPVPIPTPVNDPSIKVFEPVVDAPTFIHEGIEILGTIAGCMVACIVGVLGVAMFVAGWLKARRLRSMRLP